jgi:uncharacterized membrane protein
MMHYWNYDLGYGINPGFSILGFIFQLLFWWLIIMLVIKLFKWAHGNEHQECSECCQSCTEEQTENIENSNLEIIKTRYAKGEIDKKEFEQLKKDLS